MTRRWPSSPRILPLGTDRGGGPHAARGGGVITDEIADFAAALPPARGIAGLDFGTKTIGVAVSDALRSVATPLTTIKRRKFTQDAAELSGIVRNGPCGPRPRPAAQHGRQRGAARAIHPRLRPEPRALPDFEGSPSPSGTSGSARLRPKRHSWRRIRPRKRRAEVIDAVAAGYILQGALDRLRHIGSAR
jgi:putative Holliday junction resolvase